jgi:Dolichyl-phosphate-mannose-protein mannosyltransferase
VISVYYMFKHLGISVKWVGLFTVGMIGAASLADLWTLIIDRSVSLVTQSIPNSREQLYSSKNNSIYSLAIWSLESSFSCLCHLPFMLHSL